jgi:hypothetical protein
MRIFVEDAIGFLDDEFVSTLSSVENTGYNGPFRQSQACIEVPRALGGLDLGPKKRRTQNHVCAKEKGIRLTSPLF